jgi:flagellar biosynthetic protein FliQ
MGQNALYMLLMIAAPVLATVLGVGLIVSLFQAITQIHEAQIDDLIEEETGVTDA